MKEIQENGNRVIKSFKDLPKIAAIDFDGTLVADAWPEIGAANVQMFNLVKELKDNDIKLILWTSRAENSGRDLVQEAVEFCYKCGLTFDAVNRNIDEVIELTGIDTRKVYADIYIDDRAIPHIQSVLYWADRLGLRYADLKSV